MSIKLDLIIIGAGAAGLACAIEAKHRGLASLLIERGCLVNSIYRFPTNMTFFTTSDLLEIGKLPLTSAEEKPKRVEVLKYYRRVVDHYRLPIRDYEEVLSVQGQLGQFEIVSRDRAGLQCTYSCRRVIVATGYYDNPNRLGVPGEDLAKVAHYYSEPHPYFAKKVAVIGGKNSAVEAALDLYRNGAEVTLIHRGESLKKDIKYWVLPDILNRIERKEIPALLSSQVEEIHERTILVRTPSGREVLENDFVLALIGYHPDIDFLRSMGIEVDSKTMVPTHDPQTLESNVPGIYVAGALISGRMTNKIFIENGRFHGRQIFKHWPAASPQTTSGCA